MRTKDQGSAVSGTTTGYAFNLMKGGLEVWTYNSLRFNTPGTAFSRPSGAAPVTLQLAVDNLDSAPRRWHLEAMANNRYRIRNGNPAQGTECACRIAGTTNVRVTTCGTSSAFLSTRDRRLGQAEFCGGGYDASSNRRANRLRLIAAVYRPGVDARHRGNSAAIVGAGLRRGAV